MSEKRIRFPMGLKFFIGLFALAFMLVGPGAYLVQQKSKMKSRKDYLAKHFKRYVAYQNGLGQAVATVADTLAHDDELRAALARQQDDLAPTRSAEKLVSALYTRMRGKNSIRPDLLVVFDKNGKLIWRNKDAVIKAEEFRTMKNSGGGTLAPITQVKTDNNFFNKVFVHNGQALQLAGVPIRAPGEETVVGGLLLGVDVTRYMSDYMHQSDARVIMQHRLVMTSGDNVVASVFPKGAWDELADKLKNWTYKQEGHDKQKVATLKQGDYDFYVGSVRAFDDESGNRPQLYLLRSRSNLKGREATIPVKEIIIGVVLSGIIAWLLSVWITRPMKSFVRQSKAILEGGADLSQRLEIRARDETADLAHNINHVFARLHGLASDVRNAAFQVGASSTEISAASKQMMTGLQDQTLKIESSTAAVTELSASIQQVASNAVQATDAAEKSNVAVTAAVDRMQQIRGAVENAGNKMQDLGDSSKRIGNIVEVIRQISEQTSLLALNASIEAAHAGEQGRGFAVVAEEVSSLAGRVGQSAKDIEGLIQTIKEQTTEALHSMRIGTSEVEQGTQLVTATLQDLRELISVVKDTAGAVQEQAHVSDEIARNMDAVQNLAAEMVMGSQEAVEQGDQLASLAYGLEQSVGGFNLDRGDPAPPMHDPHKALHP